MVTDFKETISFDLFKQPFLMLIFLIFCIVHFLIFVGWIFLIVAISLPLLSERLSLSLIIISTSLLSSSIFLLAVYLYSKTSKKLLFWVVYSSLTLLLFLYTSNTLAPLSTL